MAHIHHFVKKKKSPRNVNITCGRVTYWEMSFSAHYTGKSMEFPATGCVYYGYIYCNFTETVTFSEMQDRA